MDQPAPLYTLTPEQKKVDINKRYNIQKELRMRHSANRQYLPLALDIPEPRDYMDIISFCAGDG